MKQLHYGIVSTATIVPRFVKAINHTTHSRVRAIASRSLSKAQMMAQQLEIPYAYGSYQELYEDADIHVIYIASLNSDHYEQIKQALHHGKHVICEKPFVLQRIQAEELFNLAKQKQCFLMEAQKSVFLPINLKLKQFIQSKKLGELRQIDFTQSYRPDYPMNHWMCEKHQGGALFGSAAYPIELMMFLLDQPYVSYQIHGTKMETGCLDAITMTFVCNHKILATSRIAMNVLMKNLAVFYFDHGYIEVEDYWKARKATVFYRMNNEKEAWSYPCEFEMIYEVDHIADCILKRKLTSPVMSPEMTIHCVDIVENMYHIMENNK